MRSTDLQRLNSQKRIRFQLKLLAATIDEQKYPIEKLVLLLNWDEQDLAWTEKFFRKYNQLIKRGDDVNWATFEKELIDRFGISYDTVEQIVRAYSGEDHWPMVCSTYSRTHPRSETTLDTFSTK